MQKQEALGTILQKTLNGQLDWTRHRNEEISQFFTTKVGGKKLMVYQSGLLTLGEFHDAKIYLNDTTKKIYRAADGSGKPDFVGDIV